MASLAFTAAPALAAAPETPETGKASAVTATTATLEGGVLNPHAKGEVGEYEYRFRVSETECEGESSTAPTAAAGNEKEAVPPVDLTNLQPNAKYTFCLVEHNLGGEYSLPSTPAGHFTTKPAVPKVESESVSGVSDSGATPVEARFEASVNANNQEVTKCEFEYEANEPLLAAPTKAPCEPATLEGVYGGQFVDASVSGLTAKATYYYRVVATNATGASTGTPIEHFETPLRPETPLESTPKPLEGHTATLHGVLNPGAEGDPGSYEFRYLASPTECVGGVGKKSTASKTSAGHEHEVVEVPVSGLDATTTYTVCLLAKNEAGEETLSAPQTFTTPAAAPEVTGESASNITASTATVSAQVDPGGLPSTYHAEYVTEAQFDAHGFAGATVVPVPDAHLAAAVSPVGVSENLAGLQAGTAYHFRFVASNSEDTHDPSAGAGAVFTTPTTVAASGGGETHCTNATYSGFSALLPDCRSYELVSTSATTAEPFVPEVYVPATRFPHEGDFVTLYPFRAAADGDSVAYVGDSADKGGTGNAGAGVGNEWLSSRATGTWQARDIAPPVGEETLSEGASTVYKGFSENLETGVLTSHSQQLAAHAEPQGAPDCEVLYSTEGTGLNLHALFSTSNVPGDCGEPVFAGGSSDYSHTIFETQAALTPEAIPANGNGEDDLYESDAGHLRLVNLLPGEVPAPNATFGGRGESAEGQHLFPNFSNVISEDGSRIFWTDLEAGPNLNHIFVRENGSSTAAVSAGEATYLTATPDGEYAFYLEAGELWRWRFDPSTGTESREQLPGTGSAVLGVVGTSADGSYVYFVSGEALAPGAPSVSCVEALGGPEGEEEAHGKLPPGRGCNLYVFHEGAPTPVKFIATVAPKDDNIEKSAVPASDGMWATSMELRTAQVAPDGLHLVFESSQQLTGYDNSGLEEENDDRGLEIFVYSAEEGRIVCASCGQRGVKPSENVLVGGTTLLPVSNNNTFMRRWMSADGNRVFFDTSQPLAPRDANGEQDVYEWEREGSDPGCPVQTPARQNGGCQWLLSGGDRKNFSYFVDASASGDDVFFTTVDRLSPQDQDEEVSLYDARVGGGLPDVSQACTGTGCQGVPPAPPLFATPSSVTFNGVGNYPPPAVVKKPTVKKAVKCKKGFVKKKVKKKESCVKKPEKKQTRAKKSAHTNRRAPR